MLALLAALQFQLQAPSLAAVRDDSFPTVTLPEALRRATGLDPSYVAAVGLVDNARWARRSAFAVFLLPAVAVETDATKNLPAFFNFGTLRPESYAVSAQVAARFDLFTGGQKVAELTRSAAALDAAHAGELQARFDAALRTEAAYYTVLADAELTRVARERAQRAEQQLGVARARVASGAAVQTDSLQLRLELSRAQVGLLLQQTALRVARLSLGSRIGAVGPVDAVPLDSVLPATPPLTLDAAVEEAANQQASYLQARAAADIAAQAVAVARESYRVQQSRYRAGASTILDLLKAQSDLDDAESGLVAARYAARLALAGLETIVGRRLFPEHEYR